MDTRLYPSAKQVIPTSQVITVPVSSDLIKVYRGNSLQKAISIANLFATPPALTKLTLTPTPYIVSGAISASVSFVTLNSATPACAMTIAAPAAGRLLVITQIDSGTAGHTVTLTAGTYDGTTTIATFNALGKSLVLFGVSATRFLIVANVGSVGLSGP